MPGAVRPWATPIVYQCIRRYASELDDGVQRCPDRRSGSWYVDETYVKGRGDPPTADGGLKLAADAEALAIANHTHPWVNTPFQGAKANLVGGRDDPLMVGPGAMDQGWGSGFAPSRPCF